MPEPRDLIPVILAGGSGVRLWPRSRSRYPKHLLRLFGRHSLLQDTVLRLSAYAPPERMRVVVAASQREAVEAQLRALEGGERIRVLVEPEGRNTAAAVALAAEDVIAGGEAQAVLFICPADHRIGRPELLREAVTRLLPAARAGWLGTFGIRPDRPETGFGYIERAGALDGCDRVFAVRRFIEKPPRAEAERLVNSGDCLWNSGMFLMRADRVRAELAAHAPEIARSLARALQEGQGGPDPARYREIPALPIDKAVLERSGRVAVTPVDPDWSDVGSWQAVWAHRAKDEAANALSGDVVAEDARRNLVEGGRRLIALLGVEDLAVVDAPDALLIARLDGGEALKRLVGLLESRARAETRVPLEEEAAWGHGVCLWRGEGLALWRLMIRPGGRWRSRHPAVALLTSGRVALGSGGQARVVAAPTPLLLGPELALEPVGEEAAVLLHLGAEA